MKTSMFIINDEQRTYRAFTLIELVVAVALLAMVFFFAGTIFKVSIGACRTAGANAEIMQNLRVITDQLNADFKGISKDGPFLIWFEQDENNPEQRYDQVMLFADGDFHSIQPYENSGVNEKPDPNGTKIVRGNVARIYYGQAKSLDPSDNEVKDPNQLKAEGRLLARRRHILSADSELDEWPDPANIEMSFDEIDTIDGYTSEKNELYEHDSVPLSQWKTVAQSAYENAIFTTCFDQRSPIDTGQPRTFHKLVCGGVGSFAIQWAYGHVDNADKFKEYHWYPSADVDGDGSDSDSHFDLINKDKFGVLFNVPDGSKWNAWYPIGDTDIRYDAGINGHFKAVFYPKALRFTFRLYDSKGILEEGREFTHIVYLEN